MCQKRTEIASGSDRKNFDLCRSALLFCLHTHREREEGEGEEEEEEGLVMFQLDFESYS